AGAANSMAMAPADKIIDFAAELMSPHFFRLWGDCIGPPFASMSRHRRDGRAFLLETIDLLIVVPAFAQHFARMLAVERRADMHLARCGRELHGKPERLDGTESRMLDLDDHFACKRLLIGKRLQHVVN